MAKNTPSTKEGGKDVAAAALPTTSTDTAPAEQPAAPVPAPLPRVRSDSAPLKPGVRMITLAQARAHHAKA